MDSGMFRRTWCLRGIVAILAVAALMTVQHIAGQGFTSGSDGSDGPLNLTTAGTFDLSTLGKDPDGDNIYNFTTINIAAGVTLTLSGQKISGPVVFLAQGDVVIAGVVDLRGAKGHTPTSVPGARITTSPGPGGYPGGVGGNSTNVAQTGSGPGGGAAGNGSVNSARGGGFTGNSFLVPLVGGSGGGGQRSPSSSSYGGGGGSGGGAILIASSTSINITGSILATGGEAGDTSCNCTSNSSGSGAGAGGGIRLVTPVLRGSGLLVVQPGFGFFGAAAAGGTVRLEAFQNLSGLFADGGTTFRASPTALALAPHAALRVASVGGIAVPASPTGFFTVPDVVINTASPVPVNLEAQNIPVGTTVRLFVFSESGPDLIVDTPGLVQGPGNLLTTTVNVTFPTGYSRGFAKASYTKQF